MPFEPKIIAIRLAVVAFFAVAAIGVAVDLPPAVSSYRAVTAAIGTYVAVVLVIRAVNAILFDAIITNQLKQKSENDSDRA